jgi:hypothetical protein
MNSKILFYAIGLCAGLVVYSRSAAGQQTDTTKSNVTTKPVPGSQDTSHADPVAANAKGGADSAALASALNDRDAWTRDLKEKYKAASGSFNWILGVTSLLTLGIFVWLIEKSAICKDPSFDTDSTGAKTLKDKKLRPFSFSRFQCLWWTAVIFSSYTSCCIYFWELVPLNSTSLVLLGAGLAVTGFGAVLDNRQIATSGGIPRHQDLSGKPFFISDILSDDYGISPSRLQAFLFNIVFGLGFILGCAANIKKQLFPFVDFDQWQYALLGISATGYLGMKSGENGPTTQAARAEAARQMKAS